MKEYILLALATVLSISMANGQVFEDSPSGNGAIYYNGGHVGIGVSTPELGLHVGTGNILLTRYDGSGYQVIKSNLSITGGVYGGGLAFSVSGDSGNTWNSSMFLQADGKIGIGTKSPESTFHLANGNFLLTRYDGSGYQVIKSNLSITGGVYGGGLAFSVSGDSGNTWNTNLFLQADGKVGIGTKNPDSKLTVAGKIHTQEVQVTVNAGADFVFDEDYKLTSLEELDHYVKSNKHLPEIASAKEMEAEGIHLAEMNIKLLQKIEELTLHLIEQNTMNIKQERLIELLQLEVLALKAK